MENQYEHIEKIKNDGNAYFKQKNMVGALEKFDEGVKVIEVDFAKEIKQIKDNFDYRHPLIKLYQQLLTNKALCELNNEKYELVLISTQKVLDIDINNAKALYRNALAHKKLGEKILQKYKNVLKDVSVQDIKLLKQHFEESRFQLEILDKLEPDNKSVKIELSDVVKTGVRIKIQARELEQKFPDQFEKQQKKNSEQLKGCNEMFPQQNNEKISDKKQPAINKKVVNELDTNRLQQISKMAIEKNTGKLDLQFITIFNQLNFNFLDQLIAENSLPESASVFERDMSAFKSVPEKLYLFLKKIPASQYKNLYKSKDIPVEILLQIVKCLQTYGAKNDQKNCAEIMDGISETNKFKLCIMCLTKGEKQQFKNLFDEIEAEESLYKKYGIQK